MNQTIKIKICGMRHPENIAAVAVLRPDYLGFIFHPGSSRYVGAKPPLELFSSLPDTIGRIGVFVDEDPHQLRALCRQYGFFAAQLHGRETPAQCRLIRENGLQVIKAFALDEQFDFRQLEAYAETVNYFLFDTRGSLPGGTGRKFNWQLLERYRLAVPFFLSGGIGPADAPALLALQHPQFYAADVNSSFEQAPALKNVCRLKPFIRALRHKERNSSGSPPQETTG
ncbi:MAG: phosphoribosylanthranilate isomerase [Mangrovibacterium sp.]